MFITQYLLQFNTFFLSLQRFWNHGRCDKTLSDAQTYDNDRVIAEIQI